uniref:Putative MotA/TolQ/ExbB proton channel family protein n=1 Tax=viral metagenome TaxID=1070528 RepID=A0A6M3K3B5_9ZZZZ
MGWFVSDLLLTLGMIGTVVGFIYMLSTTFQQLDPSNIASMKGMIGKMGTGMGTALYTTASGLICSMLLRVQLYNMNQCINEVQDAVP